MPKSNDEEEGTLVEIKGDSWVEVTREEGLMALAGAGRDDGVMSMKEEGSTGCAGVMREDDGGIREEVLTACAEVNEDNDTTAGIPAGNVAMRDSDALLVFCVFVSLKYRVR